MVPKPEHDQLSENQSQYFVKSEIVGARVVPQNAVHMHRPRAEKRWSRLSGKQQRGVHPEYEFTRMQGRKCMLRYPRGCGNYPIGLHTLQFVWCGVDK